MNKTKVIGWLIIAIIVSFIILNFLSYLYAATVILFSILGVFMSSIAVIFVVEIIKDVLKGSSYKRRQCNHTVYNQKKIDKVGKSKTKKSRQYGSHIYCKKESSISIVKKWIGNCFAAAFMLLVFAGIPVFCFYIVIPYYQDMPYILTNNYETASGNATIPYVKTGRKSWGYDGILVNNVWYHINPRDKVKVRTEKITIKYLPHTKIITEIDNDYSNKDY